MKHKLRSRTRHYAFSCLFTVLLFTLLPVALFAQQIRVTGVVVDSSKDPVIGVNVLLRGTTIGATTDIDGKYVLDAPGNGILVFSYLGMHQQEVPVNGRTTINVTLEEDAKLIDEVVVVGYGTMKKSDLTGSVGTVTTEELTQLSTVDIGQAIAGRVAGVDVISNSGAPGSGNKIRIRGYGTINSSDPLYVVDGFPVSDIDYLSPQDIESLEILKDASATAIYGSRGANGVVLIKTKGGRFNSKIAVNATIYGSMSHVMKKIPLLNAWEFATLKKELYSNSGMELSPVTAKMFDYVIDNKYTGTDWTDEVTRSAYSQNYSVDVNGGSDWQTFSVGGTYSKTNGVLKYNNMDVITIRANNNYKLHHGIGLGVNVVYSSRQTFGGNGDGNYYGSVWPSVLRADPLAPAWDTYTDNWGEIRNSDSSYQPARRLYMASKEYAKNSSEMLIGNLSLQISDLFSIKGLSFSSQYGIRRNFGQSKTYTPVWYVSADQNNSTSSLSVDRNNFSSWLWNGYMTYNKSTGKHNVNITLGSETQEFELTSLNASASDVPADPNNRYISMTETPSSRASTETKNYWERMASFFIRANYSFASKYLLTITGRADGSSKFISHWGYFPSFSLGWNLQEEMFVKNLNLPFNQLKMRAGWGQVGNSNSAGIADVYALMVQGSNAVLNNEIHVGSTQEKLPNSKLQWEAAEQLNFGIDFGIFDMRLTGTLDYFIRTTRDMILATQIPLYVGNTRPNMNLGKMRNRGLETTFRWSDRVNDFSYSVGLNASFITNEVISLGTPDPVWGGNIARLQVPFTRTVPGMEMAHFYGYKTTGIFQNQDEINNYKTSSGELMQPNAAPGDVKFAKTSDDGLPLNDNDRTYLGSGMADVTLGINATAAYKGFDISLFLQSSIGNEIANAAVMDLYSSTFEQYNMSKNMINRWTGEGSTNKYPRLYMNDLNQNGRFSDRYVEDGSYLRVKNIQLGYTLPAMLTHRFKVERLRFYISADNLCVLTGYSGFDPELGDYLSSPLNNGIDLATYPRPRTIVAGLNLTF
ncbi:MAG: TonB-dependent receptor [Tannerella sp.]|jgi:TonB-linked SusC/RagA family outer membrane protein|nr:TonB-dependent receptor [Tannerella sp.]